ncbi:hypothetical protein E4Z66_15760 [Aliishimia ponticola]|uniref:Uncharacterized protein n=1 Tax=Aliishimia ponticola TaxID=2499833 RepID=A0A4S4N9I9_9RHOB|nr:hypothetical protein [Aliishimia ponticola]THH35275.1 hypothetical protein E4Z66_15760 [Aliishimia ponticola]
MPKLIAILNVIAWSGFWAFGYLALSAHVEQTSQMVTAVLLAALGAGAGMFCWMWLVRHSEATGYAKPANRVEKLLEEETL